MDANQTRFQLVFGQTDWFGNQPVTSPPAAPVLAWRASDATVGLPQELFVFSVAPGAPVLGAAERRGAAQDRYGNYYWIGPAKDEVLFLAPGQQQAQHFWSAADLAHAATSGSFGVFSPLEPQPPARYTMGGLAVTTEHYLLVGLTKPAGLLLFDLYTGGAPLVYRWPTGTPFTPFDMAAAPDGGVWILDRVNRCYWGLDPYFRVLAPPGPGPAQRVEFFRPASLGTTDTAPYAPPCDFGEAIASSQAMPIAATHPVGIAALPDGSVLILSSPSTPGYSQVYRYLLRDMIGAPVALNRIDLGTGTPASLLGQDLAFAATTPQPVAGVIQGTLYIADTRGAQTFTFAYTTANADWALEPIPQFYPMLRYGGKGLVTGPGGISYDFDERWTPLAAQPRPTYKDSAVWQLPQIDADPTTIPAQRAFDGREPGCVWHRLMMDGTMPAGTQVVVKSRAADSRAMLANAQWNTEPAPYLRATGAELPYYRPDLDCSSNRTGTWELLFQAAKGRYLQLQLTFNGNGRSTPRIQAVRAYYPRFSYLTKYLPAVYQDNTASASFLERYLANPEGFFTAIEGRIQQVQELFDSRTVPSEYLPWLASWLGIGFDFTWSEELQRFFLANAPLFFQTRGTLNGVVRMIRMSLDQCADASLFDPPDAEHFSVRIVEHFMLTTDPGVVLGDPTDVQAPSTVTLAGSWTPAQGAGPIDQLFRSYLSSEYSDIHALNKAWLASFAGFDDPALRFPAVQPAASAASADWAAFIGSELGFTYALVTNADAPAYQRFLMQRYPSVSALNTAYGLTGPSALSAFADVQTTLWSMLASGLPLSGVFLQDWIQFVSVVLPTQQNAYRFSVIVPVQLTDSVATQVARLNLAQRITGQEKPAHTDFDVKLYWAAFCAGQARVGIETVVGPSSRFAAMQLDQSTLGSSYLSFTVPWNVRGRMVPGRDQLQQPKSNRCGESAI